METSWGEEPWQFGGGNSINLSPDDGIAPCRFPLPRTGQPCFMLSVVRPCWLLEPRSRPPVHPKRPYCTTPRRPGRRNVRAHSLWRRSKRRFICGRFSYWPSDWLSSEPRHGAKVRRGAILIAVTAGMMTTTDGIGTKIEDAACVTMIVRGVTPVSSCAAVMHSCALSVAIGNRRKPVSIQPCAYLIGCNRSLALPRVRRQLLDRRRLRQLSR